MRSWIDYNQFIINIVLYQTRCQLLISAMYASPAVPVCRHRCMNFVSMTFSKVRKYFFLLRAPLCSMHEHAFCDVLLAITLLERCGGTLSWLPLHTVPLSRPVSSDLFAPLSSRQASISQALLLLPSVPPSPAHMCTHTLPKVTPR